MSLFVPSVLVVVLGFTVLQGARLCRVSVEADRSATLLNGSLTVVSRVLMEEVR